MLLLATAGSEAHAQAWLSDRQRAEGIGLRVGDLELHPGISAEGGYSNNVYFSEGGPDKIGSAMLRLAPHLLLSTLGAERGGQDVGATPGLLQFRGGVSASLLTYFADNTPPTDIGADANLQLTIAPERPVSFTLTEVFNRSFRPFNDPIVTPGSVAGGDSDVEFVSPDYVRYSNLSGARLKFQTAGGLLAGTVGYRFGYAWYESPSFQYNNNLTHSIDLNASWEFFPKTALFYDGTFTHQNYTNNGDAPPNPSQPVLSDGNQIMSRVGINGAITPRISATLAAGYAVGFFEQGDEFEGLTLNAEGRWVPSQISELSLGFERAFMTAYQGNYVLRNQVYSRLRYFFGGAFVISGKLAVEFLDFGIDPIQGERDDTRYIADVSGEYRFVDWLAVTVQFAAIVDDTDFVSRIEVPTATGGTTVITDPAEFSEFEGWLGLRAFF